MAVQAHAQMSAVQDHPHWIERDLQRFLEEDPDESRSNHPWDKEAMMRFEARETLLDLAIDGTIGLALILPEPMPRETGFEACENRERIRQLQAAGR